MYAGYVVGIVMVTIIIIIIGIMDGWVITDQWYAAWKVLTGRPNSYCNMR